MGNAERLAVASVSGITERYAAGRHISWDQATQEIRAALARHRIPADRVREVLSTTAAGYARRTGTTGWYREAALRLLVDLGADLGRAAAIRTEREKA